MSDESNLVLRRILAAVCGFTALAGLWLCVMEWVLKHSGFEMRALLDLAFVVQSVLTLAFVFGLAPGAWRWIAAAGAVLVAYFGGSAVVRNLQQAHFEGFVIVIGAALVLQGLLTIAATTGPLLRGRAA
jgi:hypothetical protein